MNEARNDWMPVGLRLLLVYQGLLVLASLYYVIAAVLLSLAFREYGLLLWIAACALWGMAIAYPSVGMARRKSQGFLVGMICHLLLVVLGMVGLGFGYLVDLPFILSSSAPQDWVVTFLLFTLIWLPVSLSAWAFFYLRRLRKRELADNSAEPSAATDGGPDPGSS